MLYKDKKLQGLDSDCIINEKPDCLDRIETLGLDGFREWIINNTPKKIYKYFPNTIKSGGHNYSLEALENNTIYLNDSAYFDDCFDCVIDMNFEKFHKLKLKEYCVSFNIPFEDGDDLALLASKIAKFIYANGISKDLEKLIHAKAEEKEKLASENFYIRVCNEVVKTKDWDNSIYNVIQEEFEIFRTSLRKFKMSCFSTSPKLNRMWSSSYGNYNKGFCIEYTIEIEKILENVKKYLNFFPVIYSNVRNDCSKFYTGNNEDLDEERLWQYYFNGLLRKNEDWKDQSEWRVIFLDKQIEYDYKGKNPIPFFKISKVFLGNKMSKRNRDKVISICEKHNIKCVGLVRTEDSFILDECKGNCSNCQVSIKMDLFMQYLHKKKPSTYKESVNRHFL